jgi:hypothetical protein
MGIPVPSVLVMGAFLAVTACGTGVAAAQPPAGSPPPGGPPRAQPLALITVSGVGRVSVRPDTAVATVGAEARAPRLEDATADVARRVTAVLARVKALGVAERDIQTVGYSIEPLVAPRRPGEEDQPPRIAGYRATNVVQLKVRALDSVGRVLDEAVAAGANTIRSLHFTVDDPSRAEGEAREKAVKNAAAKARQLADAAGVRLGEIVLLSEGGVARPVIERFARTSLAAAPMAPGPVETGEQEIAVTVEAHYRIAR